MLIWIGIKSAGPRRRISKGSSGRQLHAARAGHYPRMAATSRMPGWPRPGRCPANIRRPWPGAARPRPVQAPHTRTDPQRGSRETPEHSGTGAHPRRRPADLDKNNLRVP